MATAGEVDDSPKLSRASSRFAREASASRLLAASFSAVDIVSSSAVDLVSSSAVDVLSSSTPAKTSVSSPGGDGVFSRLASGCSWQLASQQSSVPLWSDMRRSARFSGGSWSRSPGESGRDRRRSIRSSHVTAFPRFSR